MKILLTGGGTGGHFYPLMAVAEELNTIIKEKKLIDVQIFYMADSPYNERMLFDRGIQFRKISAGKMRRYFSILNFFDIFKTAWGVFATTIEMFSIYPDVVFGKGGYVSFPALFAARILGIPVIIHESDSTPGRVNKWAGKFAKKVAVSYPQAAEFFNPAKVAFTGNPIRKDIQIPLKNGAYEYLGLEVNIPVVTIIGGSQGSKMINETLMECLPQLVEKYQLIHQTGKKNNEEITRMSEVILRDSLHKKRYKPLDYLNEAAIRMAAGASSLIISRAGSTIFEIAAWGLPSIIIPIPESISHDQRSNAFGYARSGACVVIEEKNLTPHILYAEIDRLLNDPAGLQKMGEAAKSFAHLDAARKIADEIISIALTHEK